MTTEYKQTPIGKIPKDWDVVKLGKNIDVLPGYAFSSQYFNEKEGIPLIRIRDLGEDSTEALYKGPYDDGYLVDAGNILVSMDGEFKANVWRGPKGLLNQRVLKVWPKDENRLDKLYLYYALHKPLRTIELQVGQTTVKHLSTEHLDRLFLALPSLPEQRRIAEVLSAVDVAIQKVDEAIAKTERLKKGLMQKLLTKGIGHKEFKDTEIGRIPKEWEVVRLGDESVADIIMGQSPPSSTYNKEGVGLPFLQGKMEFGEIYPSPIMYCSTPIKIAETNDILLSVRAPVGDVNIAPFRCCIGRGLAAIRAKVDNLHHLFLFYCLRFNGKKFESLSSGSTFKAIRKQEIEMFLMLLPSLPEQQKIAEILSTVDKKLELERKRKEKFERIKKGLMDDLLTGRKKVKVAM